VVQADVAREAADALMTRLREEGFGSAVAVSLETVDAALGDNVTRAREAATGNEADALVWDQLCQTTGEEAGLSTSYLVLLVVATLIAAVGLLTDSQVLIVGAMVLGRPRCGGRCAP